MTKGTVSRISKVNFFFGLLFLFAVSGCGGSTSDDRDERLSAMVEAEWSEFFGALPSSPAGISVFGVTEDGNYFASHGMEEGFSPDTHFRVASNTKTFTAAAIMLLNQEGKLRISDHITDAIPGTSEPYLPADENYSLPYRDQITIRQLLDHRAGVFDLANDPIPQSCRAPYAGGNYSVYMRALDDNHQFTLDELAGVVSHCRLSYFAPGADYKYSNTGYTLLAKIIERVSGLSFAEFIQQHLLDPNGLHDTSVPYLGTDAAIPEPFAHGYVKAGGEIIPWAEDNMSLNVAEGNIISTSADLAKFIRRLINADAGLSRETIDLMTSCDSETSHRSCYGLGVSHLFTMNGYGHTGAHPGYLSLMMHNPRDNITIIVFTNFIDFDDLGRSLSMLIRVGEKAMEELSSGGSGVNRAL